jgi:general secretion pathway protein A
MSGGPLSYEPFFGLTRKPFSLASDPEFLYESPSHAAALAALLAGIRRREGLLAFTGDVGTGKTTICRAVLRNLDRTTFSAFIPDPFASREDLLKMLLVEFGVTSVQDITTGQLAHAGRTELSYLLSSFLDTLVPLDAFVVVFIDEAQNMSLSLLEEVRVLSDAFNRHGQLQVVLVGQLELLEKLKSPTMRQLDQRVSVYTRLEPLSVGDVMGYVQHRLQVAGASPNRPVFAPSALSLLHEASGGVPRLINRICDRALHVAHELRSPLIDGSLIVDVVDDVPSPALSHRDMTTSAPVVPGGTSTFATKVDAWLTHLDGGKTAPGAHAGLSDFVAEPVITAAATAPVENAAIPFEAPLRRRLPERYIHKLGRRWARAVVVAILALVALNAVVAGASYVPARLTPHLESADLPPAPAAPRLRLTPLRLPAGPEPESTDSTIAPPPLSADDAQYSVAVGAFSTTRRADLLLATLTEGGFHAFRVVLPNRGGVLHQVMVGPFAAESAAANELKRLQATGGYDDARVMSLRAPGVSPRRLEENVP